MIKKSAAPTSGTVLLSTGLDLRFLLTGHFETDLRLFLRFDRNLLAGFAEFLVPNLDVISSRRNVSQLEAAGIVGDADVGAFGGHQPSLHPSVNVAFHFDGFGFIDLYFQSLFEFRLGHIERGIGLAVGMNVVKNAVGIQNLDSRTHRKGQHVGLILTAILIESDFLGVDFLALLDIGNRDDRVGEIPVVND